MRYVIYESKDDLVAVEKQLEFLESYVYLERLRSPGFLRINFQVHGEYRHLRVAPLILITFIENAFKHGSKDKDLQPFIEIILDISREDRLAITIENSIDPGYQSKTKGGVGLENVKKQLDLLYLAKHNLTIRQTQNRYKVELTIFVS
jgi:LytS/YehU family sensor histidine kinase